MRDLVLRQMQACGLTDPGRPLWVAVSGGVDSMVLLHVLHRLGHACHVAHVDHGLRGAESDADRDLVEVYARDLGVPFRARRVDVKAHAAGHGMSVQMAARELRMSWFRELVAEGPDLLALAHHRDDAVETLFIQLLRGMGLHGWDTIAPRSGPLLRPFLAVDRGMITAYAVEHAVPFREDASNTDPKYLRNRIRHELLPLLEDLRPGALRVLGRDTVLLGELLTAALRDLEQRLGDPVPDRSGTLRIPFRVVLEGGTPHAVLHRLLQGHGVHPDRIADILRAVQRGSTGASFPCRDHRVLVDREEIVIDRPARPRSWTIQAPDQVPPDCPLIFLTGGGELPDGGQASNMARFDAGALAFPMELRTWRPGDRMQPAGMQGSRLVSDMLIDAKVPMDRKERTLVLVSGGRIAWLCGHRLADGFQEREGGQVLIATLLPMP